MEELSEEMAPAEAPAVTYRRYLENGRLGSMMGGSSFVSHLLHTTAAIESGLCEVALITYGSTQLSEGGFRGVSDPPEPYETPYGPRYPVSMYALAASRHIYEYGTTREQLAEVALAHGNGGVISSQVTAVLGRESVL